MNPGFSQVARNIVQFCFLSNEIELSPEMLELHKCSLIQHC